ncbi:gluconokinase, GntK/IdnK-type [Thermoleptolyngbya sp. C42_A2020_037]|uniref:gluconokinase n=1 Tax=Thermoleptolyngbya sp. C42_A2020_037 TaxID=2747799 RepID=UPI0025E24ACF|nr:gluconokinase, GntK/IdnK-type [Thermoleptolyngbya sp. C42_A2020_037]
MTPSPIVWLIMGVAGSGKTVVGRRLAQWLECDFLEGDRRHSPANIAKMQAQIPLDEGDRRQWLLDMQDDIQRAIALRRETVITCSALKRAYRTQLAAPGGVQLVWLDVPPAELERRLSNRLNHYMKLEMLKSQLAAFESVDAEEAVIRIDGSLPPDAIVADWLRQATQQFPALNLPWWQRLHPESSKRDP